VTLKHTCCHRLLKVLAFIHNSVTDFWPPTLTSVGGQGGRRSTV